MAAAERCVLLEPSKVAKSRTETANPIDALMERASRALVRRQYFDAERLCVEALRAAHQTFDYERMARVLLPLEEARRQKRDLAFDTGHVGVVNEALPEGSTLEPGCYLVCPPRVGADGRALREAADRNDVPTIVVVREPTTRQGLWPIVALGPVTVRTKVTPPKPKGKSRAKAGAKQTTNGSAAGASDDIVPSRTWFVETNEALGDAAIASIEPSLDAFGRVEALVKRLEAHPDHEKLHQALGDACRACLEHIAKHGKPKRPVGDLARAREEREDFDSDL